MASSAAAEGRIKIEDLLESVADAVSAIVLFANDVKDNSKLITHMRGGIGGLKEATEFLINEAMSTVNAWKGIGNPDLAKEMEECNTGIRQATSDVSTALDTLANDHRSQTAKQQILDAGKGIMKYMVRLLQLNDLFEITVLLKQIQILRLLIKERDDQKFAFDEFGQLLHLLGTMLEKRLNSVHESKVRQLMDDSVKELQKITEPLTETLEEFQSSYDPEGVKHRREIMVKALNITLKKAYEAVKLSAKSPFDLSMLDKEFDDFGDETEFVSTKGLSDQLDALAEAIKAGDENLLEQTLRALRRELDSELEAAEENAENCTDPYQRSKLRAAINNLKGKLNDMLDRLAQDAREALKNKDPEAVAALIAEIRKAAAKLLEGPARADMFQRAANIESLLKGLLQAVHDKDGLEALAIVRDISGELDDTSLIANTLAENLDDDPFRQNRLRKNANELMTEKDGLEGLTKDALKGLSADALARLRAAMDRVRLNTSNLLNASIFTTPQELLSNAQSIETALHNTEVSAPKIKSNPTEVTKNAGSVAAAVKPQLDLALGYAETQDPETKRNVTAAADALKAATTELLGVSKDITGPSSKTLDLTALQKKLLDATAQVRNANFGLVDAAIDAADEELKALAGKLQESIAKLREALDKGDVQGAAAALADIKDNIKRQVFLARMLAHATDDEELRKSLLDLAKQFESGILDDLLPAIKGALGAPGDKQKRDKVETLLDALTKLSAKLEGVFNEQTPEDKLVANSRKLNKVIENENKLVKAQNSSEATNALKDARTLLLRHRQFANAVQERCAHDPELAEQLLNAVGLLEEAYKEVIITSKTALADGSKIGPADAAVEKFKKLSNQTADLARGVKTSRKEAEQRAKEEAEKARLAALAAEADLKDKDEVYKAGHRVQQAVLQFLLDDDGTPATMLAKVAAKLAEAMKKLSEISKTGTTSELIMMAREIANFVNEIVKWANKCADDCSDPLLARELRDAAAVAKNFAVQLKILCAVKAGTSQDDPTAKKSLVICAQGLSKNVINTVHVSQVAKLKKKLKV